MPGATGSPLAFLMIAIWWAGVVLLGFALVYAVVRAGRLRRDERARLDRATEAMADEDTRARAVSEERAPRSRDSRPGPRPTLLNQFALPGSVAVIAIVLMLLATAKSPEPANQVTTGRAPGQATQNEAGAQQPAAPTQARPGNEPGSDSARGSQQPLTKRQ
jgi:hypothetical protein